MTLRKKPFKNIMRKGENAGEKMLFSQCFLSSKGQILPFKQELNFCLQTFEIWSVQSLVVCELVNPS